MDKFVALRLEGSVSIVRGTLDQLAHQMKDSLSVEEYDKFVRFVGEAMGAIYELSSEIYGEHPDIVPPELRPTKEQ